MVAPVSDRGPDPRLRAVFAAVALVLVLLGGVTWWNTSRLIDAALWVEHTREVLTGLDSLLILLRDAESGQRGYVITGLPSYLEPYRAAEVSLGPLLNKLGQLLADNAEQKQNLLNLRTLVEQRQAILKQIIDFRDQSGIEAAAASMATGAGKAKTEEIRVLVERMQGLERRLLRERSTNTAALARTAIITVSLGASCFSPSSP